MNNRMIINLIPGNTFLHKLQGATKVRLFFVLLVFLIMNWDIRLMLPVFILSIVGLISLKPNFKSLKFIFTFVILMNCLNIFLFYLADPAAGDIWTNGSRTILFEFNSHYFVSLETLWYFLSRYLKMITSFLVSMVFILSITPSEMAAGLNANGVPYKICTIVSLAFRYIPDITRDYQNIKISMQARGVEMDKKKVKLFARLKQMILILLPLIITSFERVGNIANAMDLRGYGKKKKRTYFSEHEETKADKIIKWITFGIIAFCIYYIVSRMIVPPAMKMWYPFG